MQTKSEQVCIGCNEDQKQIKEACDNAVEDQNEEECDKAAEDQEVIEIPDDDGSTLNAEIFGSPELGEEGDIETDADEYKDIIPGTDKENIIWIQKRNLVKLTII